MLVRVITAAILAGLIAGTLVSVLQFQFVQPLILEAETHEHAAHDHGAHDPNGEGEASASPRMMLTVIANLLAGVAFALLLNAALVLAKDKGWRAGAFWGLGGHVAFALAPSIGLPPELPGAVVTNLFARQLWWIGTAVATMAGLVLILRIRKLAFAFAGILLLGLPHMIGAPVSHGPGVAPEALIGAFTLASLLTNLAFWVVLGLSSGLLQARLVRR